MKGTKWLIWSIENGMWWSKNGYTSYIEEAGMFSYKEACELLKIKNINIFLSSRKGKEQHKKLSPRNAMIPLL